MASNEELAAAIKAGDRSKEVELWEQVRRLAYQRALRVVRALGDDRLADIDDLMQAAYLAMLDAVERYEQGLAFSTYFVTSMKTAFAETTGWQTVAGRKEPARAAISLNAPLTSEEGSAELEELTPDPVNGIEEAEQRLFLQWQQEIIAQELKRLPREQEKVIRLRFWRGLTRADIAAQMETTPGQVLATENAALRQMRKSREIWLMRQDN